MHPLVPAALALLQTEPSGGAPPPSLFGGNNLILFGGMALIFWFILIRPEKKERQRKAAMIEALKKNDKIVTTSGIVGRVASLGETELMLQLDQGRMKVLKSAIASVVTDDEGSSED